MLNFADYVEFNERFGGQDSDMTLAASTMGGLCGDMPSRHCWNRQREDQA